MAKQAAEAANKRRWDYPSRERHPDQDIFVYKAWCKACGICIEFCPTRVFRADKTGHAVVEHPEECIACNLCEMLCPDMAITVYKERAKKGGS